MKATAVLADFAQVAEGKLTVVGAGWTHTGPGPAPSGVGIIFDVPWNEANRNHHFTLALKDGDGNPVRDPSGNTIEVHGTLEVGRPPGHPEGASIPAPMALNIGPLPLVPGARYVWELTVDGETDEDWRLPFNTRPLE